LPIETRPGLARYQPQTIEMPAPRVSYPETTVITTSQSTLGDYWRVLRKRKWAVLGTMGVVMVLVTIATFRMTPLYEASARIAITQQNTDNLNVNEQRQQDYAFDYNIELDTQAKILQSDTLALMVIDQLQLDRNPRFAPGKVVNTNGPRDSMREAMLLARWRDGLIVNKIQRTRMVEIRYLSPDPKLAAQIVNTLANVYVENNFKTRYESTVQASEWLERQLNDLQVKVEKSQEALIDFQRKNNIVGLDDKQNVTVAKLGDLNKEVTEAETDRYMKQSAYETTKQGNLDSLPELSNNALVSDFRRQESELRRQLAQAEIQFGPSYPKVQEINSQLAQVQATIKAEVDRIVSRKKADYEAAIARERMLKSSFDSQTQAVTNLNERAIEYNQLKQDADANRALYASLTAKLKEAAVTSGLRSSNIQKIDTARVPLSPSKPDVPRNLGMGLILGFVGGIALAFLLEALDNTVRTPDQVEMISQLPALGIIPVGVNTLPASQSKGKGGAIVAANAARGNEVGLVSHTRPKSEIAEAYRALRTSILLSSIGQVPKVLLLTSALPQEGKTTTSINTAIVLAQKGGKVLLVDADMRRPSVHQTMKIRNRAGLSTLLTGSSTMEEVVTASPVLPNLFVIPAGPPPPHPAELLGSSVMQEFIDRWRGEYDHIIIDTPPVLSVTDAVLLSVWADAVVLVIRSAKTTKDALRRSSDILAQVNARVMGVVVNAIDLHSPDAYYYYYGASYGGRYYDESVTHEGRRT
jgi:polysaccharide biosynthesis transport protein